MTKFFTALNPCSSDAGLNIKVDSQFVEGKDYTFIESCHIYHDDLLRNKYVFMRDSAFNDYLWNTYRVFFLVSGWHHPLIDHYIAKNAVKNSQTAEPFGSKGLLDFLIFPLLARKLIADSYLLERSNARFINTLSWLIAIPLEIVRDVSAILLTILLALTLVPILTIFQQYAAPDPKDLVLDPKNELNQLQRDLTKAFIAYWKEAGDSKAYAHIRETAPPPSP